MRTLPLLIGTAVLLAAAALLWVPRSSPRDADQFPQQKSETSPDPEGRAPQEVQVVPYPGRSGGPTIGMARIPIRLVDALGEGVPAFAVRVERGDTGQLVQHARTDEQGDLRLEVTASLLNGLRIRSDSTDHWIEPHRLEDIRTLKPTLVRVHALSAQKSVRVLSLGRPVANAEIRIGGTTALFRTDASGRAQIRLPDRAAVTSEGGALLTVDAPLMMPLQMSLQALWTMGSEGDLVVEPARQIDGVVRQADSKPVANVRAFLDGREVGRSDSEGALRIRTFPKLREGRLELIHPEYMATSVTIKPTDETPFTFEMSRGVPLRIQVIASEGVALERLIVTIATGNGFRARGHPDQEGVLTVHVPPYSDLRVEVDGPMVLEGSLKATVADEPVAVDITVERSRAVTVAVTLPDGRPAVEAQVAISDERGFVLAQHRTDSFGIYRFAGLPNHRLLLTVAHEACLSEDVDVGPQVELLRVPLEWGPAVRFRIYDTVTGKPADAARFLFLSQEGVHIRRALREESQGSGLFTLTSNQPMARSTRFVLVEVPERRQLLVPVTFQSEQEPQIQDLVLTAAEPLDGIVRDRATGLPVAGAAVRVVMEEGLREEFDALRIWVATDELGAYELPAPPNGNFFLLVTADGYAHSHRIAASEAKSIWLEPGRDLHLEAHGAEGEPLVVAVVPVGQTEDAMFPVPLDTQGKARINLRYGQYKIRMLSGGPGWTAYPSVLHFQADSSSVVVLSRDGITDLVGTVRFPSGVLGGQARLVLKSMAEVGAPEPRTTQSGGDGAFRFRSVPPGRYEVSASVTVDGRVHNGTAMLEVAPNHPPIDLLIRVQK